MWCAYMCMFVCMRVYALMCVHVCGGFSMMFRIIFDCSSSLFPEAGSLKQTQSSQYN